MDRGWDVPCSLHALCLEESAMSETVVIRTIHDNGFAHAERMGRRELKRYLRACRQMRADERLTRGARHDAWYELQWTAILAGALA